MTNEIIIRFDPQPLVIVDGVVTGCKVEATFHRQGGLEIKSLRLSKLPYVGAAQETDR